MPEEYFSDQVNRVLSAPIPTARRPGLIERGIRSTGAGIVSAAGGLGEAAAGIAGAIVGRPELETQARERRRQLVEYVAPPAAETLTEEAVDMAAETAGSIAATLPGVMVQIGLLASDAIRKAGRAEMSGNREEANHEWSVAAENIAGLFLAGRAGRSAARTIMRHIPEEVSGGVRRAVEVAVRRGSEGASQLGTISAARYALTGEAPSRQEVITQFSTGFALGSSQRVERSPGVPVTSAGRARPTSRPEIGGPGRGRANIGRMPEPGPEDPRPPRIEPLGVSRPQPEERGEPRVASPRPTGTHAVGNEEILRVARGRIASIRQAYQAGGREMLEQARSQESRERTRAMVTHYHQLVSEGIPATQAAHAARRHLSGRMPVGEITAIPLEAKEPFMRAAGDAMRNGLITPHDGINVSERAIDRLIIGENPAPHEWGVIDSVFGFKDANETVEAIEGAADVARQVRTGSRTREQQSLIGLADEIATYKGSKGARTGNDEVTEAEIIPLFRNAEERHRARGWPTTFREMVEAIAEKKRGQQERVPHEYAPTEKETSEELASIAGEIMDRMESGAPLTQPEQAAIRLVQEALEQSVAGGRISIEINNAFREHGIDRMPSPFRLRRSPTPPGERPGQPPLLELPPQSTATPQGVPVFGEPIPTQPPPRLRQARFHFPVFPKSLSELTSRVIAQQARIRASRGLLAGEVPHGLDPLFEDLRSRAGTMERLSDVEEQAFEAGIRIAARYEGGQRTAGELRRMMIDLQSTPAGRLWREAVGAFRLPTSIAASGEVSATIRQGGLLSYRHPLIAKNAFEHQIRAMGEEGYAQEIDAAMRNDPYFSLSQSFNLYHAPLNRTALEGGAEETFASNLQHTIPGARNVIRGSERAFITYLNKMRQDVWRDTIERWRNNGHEPTDRDLEQLAKFINRATGRGEMPVGLARVLSIPFFSPRLTVSRFQLVGSLFSSSPLVRREAASSVASLIGGNLTLLALAHVGGVATVELDPKSSDFLKFRVGGYRIDPWAGFQPLVVAAVQLSTGYRKRIDAGELQRVTVSNVLGRLVESKLSVGASVLLDISRLTSEYLQHGRASIKDSFTNEELDYLDVASKLATPITLGQIAHELRQENYRGAAIMSIGALGPGVSHIERGGGTPIDDTRLPAAVGGLGGGGIGGLGGRRSGGIGGRGGLR